MGAKSPLQTMAISQRVRQTLELIVMGLKLALAVIPLLTAASCSDHHPFSSTALERMRIEVSDRVTLHDLITNPEFDNSSETMLRNAAFRMTEGMGVEQAVLIFEADGATCTGSVCIWVERVSEPVGVIFYPSVRAPGPRRTFDMFRQITIRSAIVSNPADIAVKSWFRNVAEPE